MKHSKTAARVLVNTKGLPRIQPTHRPVKRISHSEIAKALGAEKTDRGELELRTGSSVHEDRGVSGKILPFVLKTSKSLKDADGTKDVERKCSCCGIRLFPEEGRSCWVCSRAKLACPECRGCAYLDERDDLHCNHCGVVLPMTGAVAKVSAPPEGPET